MKTMFCWRCQMDMLMLDEQEFARVRRLYIRKPWPSGILEEYRQITGMEETNPNAIMHHRIAQYGPPCTQCGKPLRTPEASFCAACGKVRE